MDAVQKAFFLAEALLPVPQTIDRGYAESCLRAYAMITRGNPDQLTGVTEVTSVGLGMTTVSFTETPPLQARNLYLDIVDTIKDFCKRAREAGLTPPDDPFEELKKINVNRSRGVPLSIDLDLATSYIFNMNTLLDLVEAEKRKRISLDREKVSHISWADMSLDGFDLDHVGESGLMSFLPNSQFLKIRKVKEALSSLDFTKRVPLLMFIGSYEVDGFRKGLIVSWRKMADATGYLIRRRSVIRGETKEIELDATNVVSEIVKEYSLKHFGSFYDEKVADTLGFFLDTAVQENEIYTYSVQAYQRISSTKDFIFSVDSIPITLSVSQFNSLSVSNENVYSLISRVLYGDETRDWILAAINVRASSLRGEDESTRRLYSLAGSTAEFVRTQISSGKFVIPKDLDTVEKNFLDGLRTHGLIQTLYEVFLKTGVILFFKGIDDDDGFQRADDPTFGGGDLAAVLASVDPETAMVSVEKLKTNLSTIRRPISGPLLEPDDSVESDLNAVSRIDPTGFIDLTTISGMASFLKIVRERMAG